MSDGILVIAVLQLPAQVWAWEKATGSLLLAIVLAVVISAVVWGAVAMVIE